MLVLRYNTNNGTFLVQVMCKANTNKNVFSLMTFREGSDWATWRITERCEYVTDDRSSSFLDTPSSLNSLGSFIDIHQKHDLHPNIHALSLLL